MSVNEKMTAIANAVRSKTGTTSALTLDGMTEKINGIFSAFYSYTPGSGNAYLTFEQVPFSVDLVSIILRWGINNLNSDDVYSVFYNGATSDSRYRKRNGTSSVPYNVSNAVVVTNTPDANGTYTVKIYCDGCIFNNSQQYVCFLAKRQE